MLLACLRYRFALNTGRVSFLRVCGRFFAAFCVVHVQSMAASADRTQILAGTAVFKCSLIRWEFLFTGAAVGWLVRREGFGRKSADDLEK